MVWNEAEFEAALIEADALLEPPPPEGSAQHERLMALLSELASYRPNIARPAEGQIAADRARLAQALPAFEARVRQHHRTHWLTLIGENFLYK